MKAHGSRGVWTYARGVLLAAGILLALVPPPARGQCTGGQAVTRAQIEASGAVRLTDLFALLDAARTTSIDGFDLHAAFGSGAGFQAADWALVVDGVPVDLDVFGQLHLEALPITLGEVKVARWCPGPVLVDGQWYPGGVLRLATRHVGDPEATYTVARAAVQIGNETGDPGPWRYTDRAVPNVDKWGTDLEASVQRVTWRGDYLQAGAKWMRHYATDPAALARNQGVLNTEEGPPRMRLGTASLRGDVRALGGRHHAAVFGTYLNDLGFLASVSREQPVHRLFGQAALEGHWPLSERFGLRYHLRQAVTDLAARDDAVLPAGLAAPDFGWQQRRTTARLHVGDLYTWIGASLLHQQTEAVRFAHTVTLIGLDGQHRRALGNWDVTLEGAARSDGNEVGGGLSAEGAWWSERGSEVSIRLAAARTLPTEQPMYGFWRSEGYAGVEPDEFAYAVAAPRLRTDVALRLAAARLLGPDLTAEASFGWQWAEGLFVEDRTFAVSADGIPTGGAVAAVPDARGAVLHPALALRLRHAFGDARAFYDGQFPTGGSAAFEEAWAAAPRHRAGLHATARLDRSFTAWASLQVVSGTRWPAYDATLPTRWLLDVAFDKTLWRDRLRLNVGARNLLNVEDRAHPLGAALDLRLFARASVRLSTE